MQRRCLLVCLHFRELWLADDVIMNINEILWSTWFCILEPRKIGHKLKYFWNFKTSWCGKRPKKVWDINKTQQSGGSYHWNPFVVCLATELTRGCATREFLRQPDHSWVSVIWSTTLLGFIILWRHQRLLSGDVTMLLNNGSSADHWKSLTWWL